jgi:hypothetical protein
MDALSAKEAATKASQEYLDWHESTKSPTTSSQDVVEGGQDK